MPRVLLTGFDGFAGATLNPSWLAAQQLHGRRIAGHRLVAAQLPTVFGACWTLLRELLTRHQPVLVLCLGQAGGRAALSLERIAINLDDAPIADNAGSRPIDQPIVAAGPAGYFTQLPIKAMLQVLTAAGIPAEVSQSAGTFVCNHVFYRLLHELATEPQCSAVRGGFLHVPWLPEQGAPSLPLHEMVRGLHIALRCALLTGKDNALAVGALG